MENLSKEEFDTLYEKSVNDLKEAINKTSSNSEKVELQKALDDLESTKVISDNINEIIAKQEKNRKLTKEWSELVYNDHEENQEIINETINKNLFKHYDTWCDEFQGDYLVNKEGLNSLLSIIKEETVLEEPIDDEYETSLDLKVIYKEQALSGEKSYCIEVDYKLRMSNSYKDRVGLETRIFKDKKWVYDLNRIIRSMKLKRALD